MEKDLNYFLSALNARHVKYLVVGGYAVGVHAQPRVTKYLDVFIEASSENAEAVYRALADLVLRLKTFCPKTFKCSIP